MNLNQLTLPLIPLPEDETIDSYFLPEGSITAYALKQCLDAKNGGYLYLWGPGQSGKTHLLHAASAHYQDIGLPTVFLPLANIEMISPEMLEGLEFLELICIDDIDKIAGCEKWEEAIFDLFNRVRENERAKLIITGSQPPKSLGIKLPDLVSRLSWGEVYQLTVLDDEQKLLALKHRAILRGFDLPNEVAAFIVNRIDRDLKTLFQVLDTLDRATLKEKRLISIPFVKKVLSL